MPAAPDVVGMQDIEADYLATIYGDAAVRLLGEERRAALKVERILLWERDAVLHDLVPNLHHRGNVGWFVCADFGHHVPFHAVFGNPLYPSRNALVFAIAWLPALLDQLNR